MCRLFGCRSLEPGGVAHELLHGANALRVQSKEHPDGWGLGWYEAGAPRVVRSLSPAHGDEEFERLSSFVRAPTVVAHVRRASVGAVAERNTHPFQRGAWLFAHNGTVPEWSQVAAALEERIAPSLRRTFAGETDSERAFLLFLTFLRDAATFEAAARALAQAAAEVRRAAARVSDQPASMTFLATDGRLLLACRVGRTLHVSSPEPDRTGRVAYFAVSSENPGEPGPSEAGRFSSWRDVPEGALIGVDAELRVRSATLDELCP